MDAQKRYMKSDTTRLLSVSRAAMGLRTTSVPEVRTECEFGDVMPSVEAMSLRTTSVPEVRTECEFGDVAPLVADDEVLPDVVGVPNGAFAWS